MDKIIQHRRYLTRTPCNANYSGISQVVNSSSSIKQIPGMGWLRLAAGTMATPNPAAIIREVIGPVLHHTGLEIEASLV
ncbi:hypothetical protein SAMN04487951_101156 [Vreelandella arcis]|uniref:Uncharacterized protein n=1 Tax=Vreelandella arcis TaxID=416873 RepID=A0A1G9X6N9_9GAMM|nr:hypothetical protein SAMN04487951_101156 [Halomonas arcis]